MSTHNIHFMIKFKKSALKIHKYWLSREYPMDSKIEFKSAMVNEPSVFKSFTFYCTQDKYSTHWSLFKMLFTNVQVTVCLS